MAALLDPTLDGEKFFTLIDSCHDDGKMWCQLSEDEAKAIQWISPTTKKKDGIVRTFSTTGYLREHSIYSGVTYYYHISGGNMTKEQVANKQREALKARLQKLESEELLQSSQASKKEELREQIQASKNEALKARLQVLEHEAFQAQLQARLRAWEHEELQGRLRALPK